MKCEKIEHLLAEYVDGTLSPAENAQVQEHLEQCSECAELVAELQKVVSMVRSLPEQDAPPDMADNIFAVTSRRWPRFLKKTRLRPRRYAPISAAAAVLVALIAVVAVFSNFEMHDKLPHPTMQAEQAPKGGIGKQEKFASATDDVKEMKSIIEETLMAEGGAIPAIAPTAGSETHPRPAGGITAPVVDTAMHESPQPRREVLSRTIAPLAGPRPERTGAAVRDEGREPLRDAESPGVADGLAGGNRGVGDEATFSSTAQPAPPPAPAPTFDRQLARKKTRRAEASAVESEAVAPAEVVEEAEGEPTVIQHRWESAHSGVHKPGTMIITSQTHWKKLWRLLFVQIMEKPPLPPLDFNKQVAIGVFLGLKTTGGYHVAIQQVRRAGDSLEVVVKKTAPQPGQMVTMALTQPYSVVVVPKTIDGLTIDRHTPLKIVTQ